LAKECIGSDSMAELIPAAAAETHLYPLRNKSWIALVHPELEIADNHQLREPGVYICCPIAGDFHLERDSKRAQLNPREIHLVRKDDTKSIDLMMCGRCALGFVAYVSPEWCHACPQGPTCPIAQFLLFGRRARGSGMTAALQAIQADDSILAIADKILEQRFPSDANQIELETSLLGVLSWAFARGSPVNTPARVSDPVSDKPRLRHTIKIRQAAEILRQNLDQPPTVADLGRRVGMNSSDLKRGFKALYNCSPARYSREFRLETARELLTNSSLSIAGIALDVGFLNPSQFSRAFRQQYGVNPSEVRRKPTLDIRFD